MDAIRRGQDVSWRRRPASHEVATMLEMFYGDGAARSWKSDVIAEFKGLFINTTLSTTTGRR